MIQTVRISNHVSGSFNQFCCPIPVENKKVKTLDNILDVKGRVKSKIAQLKEKLKLARETIGRFKVELAKVQKTPIS